ncbi:MAG: GAF and ANTAR domain-containing protein [Actinomycetota bacterium]|nr:GAF and ANTAR domain-containing protein [Actinomycetota bacterium]
MTNSRAGSAADPTAVHAQIARLARSVHGASPGAVEPDELLETVTRTAVQLLPRVDHAGATVVRKHRQNKPPELSSVAATGDVPRLFDKLQDEQGDGPCFEAVWTQQTVLICDTTDEPRWPALMREVAEQTPVRSILSIQLFVTDLELGALNLFSENVDGFDDNTEDIATTLAAHAAIALSNARRGQQFRSAVASRDIIGQAKGMLMERYRIDAVRAFDILRQLSQESNTPLAAVAAQVVNAEPWSSAEPADDSTS